MDSKLPYDVNVIIPYKTLCELLEASERVVELEHEVEHLSRLIGGLRGQLFEVIDFVRQLRDCR